MKFDEILQTIDDQNYSAFFYSPLIYKDAVSYLFEKPEGIINVSDPGELEKSFKNISKLIDKDFSGYFLINYETGFLFEKKLLPLFKKTTDNFIGFIYFKKENVQRIPSKKLKMFENWEPFAINNFNLNTSQDQFTAAVNSIKNYIEIGDTYQVNYTIKGNFEFVGDHKELFKSLIFNQSAFYSAFINLPDKKLLSLSPELFFEWKGNKIKTRPMKGTSHRGLNFLDDHLEKFRFEKSEKNRAENLMIVDLLRNDFGRIAKTGSVKVKSLFDVEKYESLYQMTSTVEANLKKGIDFSEIIKNVFPCGSITGAPKIRTMQIINELEKEKRGIYTGAIGIANEKGLTFNVAIRTILLDKKSNQGEIGLGSGIVWDSDPIQEYSEVKLKSSFLKESQKYFEIFETMLYENGSIFLLEEHLERLQHAAEYFLFEYDDKKIRDKILKKIKRLNAEKNYRIRLVINKWGKILLEIIPMIFENKSVDIIISSKMINSQDKFQHFKTTNRQKYNEELNSYLSKGFFDVLFMNEKNHVAEGAITNIFLKKGEYWYTPPINDGILAGVYRKYFLQSHPNTKEISLTKDDLIEADEIILTNSVRKIIRVKRIYFDENEYVEKSTPKQT